MKIDCYNEHLYSADAPVLEQKPTKPALCGFYSSDRPKFAYRGNLDYLAEDRGVCSKCRAVAKAKDLL